MARIGTVIRDTYRRPGAEALPGHLEEGGPVAKVRVGA